MACAKRHGRFLTVALIGLGLVFCIKPSPADPPLTPFYNFNTGDGALPSAPLALTTPGGANVFYGTTAYGGANGFGTVYTFSQANTSPLGILTTLYAFSLSDGAYPIAGLLAGSNGNLYGTTSGGGANGTGTLFQITPAGVLTSLHNFSATGTSSPYSNMDGANPYAGLVMGPDKNFYGTTAFGGANGFGTIFQLTPSGQFTPLHSFTGADGANPAAGLVVGPDGNLYGTAAHGGANKTGTVYQITTGGTFTTLYSFSAVKSGFFGANPDGASPLASLVVGPDKNLYGTTAYGGTRGLGTVFQITTAGKLTSLYSFGLNPLDGTNPYASLVVGLDGLLYGTTPTGGENNTGTVFEITTAGALNTLYSFSALDYGATAATNNDGAMPYSGLCVTSNGNLCGTAYYGGANGNGTIYRIRRRPSVSNFNPTSGPVGTTVTVYGRYFTGAVSVTIGSVSAPCMVVSDTQLSVVVPKKAKGSSQIVVTTHNSSGNSTLGSARKYRGLFHAATIAG
jgi:uncharacterized repeat protein (TIGR03803 family)